MGTATRTEPLTTSVRVEAPASPGAPVRVSTSDGLLAVRTVRRDRVAAEVALVATGAVLLGGDHVVVRVSVADGHALTITDVGGTVAYDAGGVPSWWDVVVTLGHGSRLSWFGLPFVVAEGADVTRTTTVRTGAGAQLALRETIAWGREGERGGRALLRSDVHDARGPVLVEEVWASGHEPVPGVLGSARVLDTALVLDEVPDPDDIGPDDLRDGGVDCPARAALRDLAAGAETSDTTTNLTALRPAHGGLLLRWLGPAAHLSPMERALTS
ncbi:urease accessory protein UreD [Ruania zhangjianzhongii]|uniref:urease accessory protein UreD n=1 Tax=Ruania zhangjianzhongii TaxID=2603206 RepID=UPI0011CB6F08|nr:urease accessory protein UreD [Ruania zhangjianzhongii]